MTAATPQNWKEANLAYLIASINMVKEELEFYANKGKANAKFESSKANLQALQDKKQAMSEPSTLDTICETFALNDFEKKILLMCAGVELMSDFGALITKLQGHKDLAHPTFNLAMAYLSGATWEAVSPLAGLRKWNLINIKNTSVLVKSKLIIDESVLHYLTGVNYLDERLDNLITTLKFDIHLVPSQKKLVKDISSKVFKNSESTQAAIISLEGNENEDQLMIAGAIAQKHDRELCHLSVHAIPNNRNEIRILAKIWNREAALNKQALYINTNNLGEADATKTQAIIDFISHIKSLVILNHADWLLRLNKTYYNFTVHKPTRKEQLTLWKKSLGEISQSIDKHLKDVVAHFDLGASTIVEAATEINHLLSDDEKEQTYIESLIWETCCKHTRPKVDNLAHLIKPIATWKDIVLPEDQTTTLKEIANQVKNRVKVYDDWGFAEKSTRGFGISALFTGESGTGKTMAAEVLANELKLDLYRIDLSQVVNKYIGETEKNLKRIFDAAEAGGAILLFDEADALFGKRSEVKDSHDRYSNIEIGYLLQRMEAYQGLAILTTNMKNAIDDAFLRRIRFVIHFKKPDAENRAIIWKQVFTSKTKLGSLDYTALSRINFPGGNIRNIALNAAFRGANDNNEVQMYHIYDAILSECDKIEKNLSRVDIEALRKSVWACSFEAESLPLDYRFLSRLHLSGSQIDDIAHKATSLSKRQKKEVNMQHILKVLGNPKHDFGDDILRKAAAYKSQLTHAG